MRGPLRRSREVRVVAGVCGGLSQATGIDVTVLRIAVVLLALGSGIGVLVYAVAWLLVPLEGEQTTILTRAVNDRRGIRLVIALVPVLFVVQILSGSRHIRYLGSISWPLFLAAAVAILIVRNASDDERGWISDDLMPMLHVGTRPHRRWSTLARILVGLAVGVGGLLLVVLGHPTGALLGPVVGCVLVVAAMVVLFGPWWLGLIRDLLAERQARALAEERAADGGSRPRLGAPDPCADPALRRRPPARGAPRQGPRTRAALVALRRTAARHRRSRTRRPCPRGSR